MKFNGKEYKRKRKEAGLTQQDVWMKTGIFATNISQYELGKKKPRRCTQTRLESIFNERK